MLFNHTRHLLLPAEHQNHATLGFQQGASLDDPGKILEGTGKDMRHVKFKNGEKINTTAVIALLKQAAS
ncbi:MAG: DUF1801 domain-containing protein [Lysobacteraceae bacterium]